MSRLLPRKLVRLWNGHPIFRTVTTYSCLYPSANVVQQCLLPDKTGDQRITVSKVDWTEAGRYLVYGGFIHSCIVHSWMVLARRFFPGTQWRVVFKKVVIDMLVFAPVALSSFYVGLAALEGHDIKAIKDEWREKFPGTWACGACVWPILQTINFRLIPFRNRAVFVGCMSFFWTTVLSYWKSQ